MNKNCRVENINKWNTIEYKECIKSTILKFVIDSTESIITFIMETPRREITSFKVSSQSQRR